MGSKATLTIKRACEVAGCLDVFRIATFAQKTGVSSHTAKRVLKSMEENGLIVRVGTKYKSLV